MSNISHSQVAVRVIPTCFVAALMITVNSKQSFIGSQAIAQEQVVVENTVEELPNPEPELKEVADHIWLARCIFSESKRPAEQELVAWVVRNRVETRYRGKKNYKDVILDPYQFSAFNPNRRSYAWYTNLEESSRAIGWRTAMKIAKNVMAAESVDRPFPISTRHFYSEISMNKGLVPVWTRDREPIQIDSTRVIPKRFRFYSGVI